MAASPELENMDDTGWPGGEADGEEEPLFADDLMDDEDEPPPLPPPMPSLGELSASRNRGHSSASMNGVGEGVFPNTQQGPGGAAAPGGDGTGSQEPTQKKRKPILTLKTERVFSEKGLRYVEKEFPKLKFRGKGHEAADLKYLMQQYEHWANMLYPKLTFKDVTDRIEALASKKDFKSQLYQMRRRAARGGRDTPPLHSDDSDQEQGTDSGHGGTRTSHLPPDCPENGATRDNGSSNDETTQEPNSSTNEGAGGGEADQIRNVDTMVVGGANSSNDIINGDVMHMDMGGAGAGRNSNTALDRLTMDAYGSSDEDD